ncbi:DNRLRE domain-containing protein [Candidatus Woesearchaeota archaeon]|nr:DNRLRE domain-containing protein [Candidatus Woesearchaeota archaeon]
MKKRNKKIIIICEVIIILIISILSLLFINWRFIGFNIYEYQPDSTEGKDTYIKQSSNEINYGNVAILSIGKDSASGEFRSLIQFNTSSIPPGTILNAKLNLFVSYSSTMDNFTVKAYRLTSPWEELETTWSNKTSTMLWENGGGDYAEEIDSVLFSNLSSSYNFTITNTVRGWINGSYPNYGIILISTDAKTGERRELISSDSSNISYRPKLIIDYTSNAVPTIINISTNTNLTNFKYLGEQVVFDIDWEDLEGDEGALYICSSNKISISGCVDKTFCSTPYSNAKPLECSYTVDNSGSKITPFFVTVCDRSNCSEINKSYFYINRPPLISIIQPNGGEIIDQSQGEYLIKFNVSDVDNDNLSGKIYYGLTPNSTENVINSNLNLTQFCTDNDLLTSTKNNCSYSWDTSGLYGDYYLTIKVSDGLIENTNSSANPFYVRSISDPIPPEIFDFWTEEDIYSGKETYFYANVSDNLLVKKVWISINTTPLTNITLRDNFSQIYNGSWIASYFGSYQYKVYAEDLVGNVNDSLNWKSFFIRAPNISSQKADYPPIVLPYHTIKINGELNVNDSLRGVHAYLTIPGSFEFLQGYPQNSFLGDISYNSSKNVSWFLSAPINKGDYNFSIVYTDEYGDSWTSPNYTIKVDSDIGGGYQVSIEGYPEVQAGDFYYAEANFKNKGLNVNADEVKISIYDSIGNLIMGPVSMILKENGIYNYTYYIPLLQTTGKMEVRVNATKDLISYYANSFFNLVGALFDIRDINVINPVINKLNISVICENKGSNPTDLTLSWNLTRVDNGELLDSGGETFAVGSAPLEKYYSPSTNYVGQVKITFLGRYSKTETAGAFKIFSTTPRTEKVIHSERGEGINPIKEGIANLEMDVNKTVYLLRSTPKTVTLNVNNIGTINLTNLSLSLEGIDPLFYSIIPKRVSSLNVGESTSFDIKFLITAPIQELDFIYNLNSNELIKQKEGKIIILSTLDYLQREITRVYERVDYIKGKITEDKTKKELVVCSEMIEEAKDQINSEEYINAGEKIKEIDACLDKVMNSLEKGRNFDDSYLALIYLSLIIFSLIVLTIIIIVMFKRLNNRSEILDFLSNKENKKEFFENNSLKEKEFEKKIKSIENKLKD